MMFYTTIHTKNKLFQKYKFFVFAIYFLLLSLEPPVSAALNNASQTVKECNTTPNAFLKLKNGPVTGIEDPQIRFYKLEILQKALLCSYCLNDKDREKLKKYLGIRYNPHCKTCIKNFVNIKKSDQRVFKNAEEHIQDICKKEKVYFVLKKNNWFVVNLVKTAYKELLSDFEIKKYLLENKKIEIILFRGVEQIIIDFLMIPYDKGIFELLRAIPCYLTSEWHLNSNFDYEPCLPSWEAEKCSDFAFLKYLEKNKIPLCMKRAIYNGDNVLI